MEYALLFRGISSTARKGWACCTSVRACAVGKIITGGHQQERSMRGGTTNVPGIVGLAEGVSASQTRKWRKITPHVFGDPRTVSLRAFCAKYPM